MRLRASSVALIFVAAVAFPRSSRAFVRTINEKTMVAVKWPRSCVTLVANVGSPPPNLTSELAANAARAAAATWGHDMVACSNFSLVVTVSDAADAPVANDSVNNLVFRKSQWEYEASALAITTVFAEQNSGVILDTDVELNAVRFR